MAKSIKLLYWLYKWTGWTGWEGVGVGHRQCILGGTWRMAYEPGTWYLFCALFSNKKRKLRNKMKQDGTVVLSRGVLFCSLLKCDTAVLYCIVQ